MPLLIPGAPGSGFVSQYMGGELPGAGARYALVPRGTPDIDPVRAAALSAAYANPANWTHTGGDAGLIGAGPGGGGFQPNLNAINRNAQQRLSAPVNRFAGLAIGDTPGGAQNAVLNIRGQQLQALQANRSYELAQRQIANQERQSDIENQLRALTLQANTARTAGERKDAEDRLKLAMRQVGLEELKTMDQIGGMPSHLRGYREEFDKLLTQQQGATREVSSAVRDLWAEASKIAESTPGTVVVPGPNGMPDLEFDPNLAKTPGKFDPVAATQKYNAAIAKLQGSQAMKALEQSQAKLEDLALKQSQLDLNVRFRIPLSGRGSGRTWVWDEASGRYVDGSAAGPAASGPLDVLGRPLLGGEAVPLARTIPGQPTPRWEVDPRTIPYGTGRADVPLPPPSLPADLPAEVRAMYPAGSTIPTPTISPDILRYFMR